MCILCIGDGMYGWALLTDLSTSTVADFIPLSDTISTYRVSYGGQWLIPQTPAQVVGDPWQGALQLVDTARAPSLWRRESWNGCHHTSTGPIITTATTCVELQSTDHVYARYVIYSVVSWFWLQVWSKKGFVNLPVSCCKLKRWPISWANVLPDELVEREASCTTPTEALPHIVFKNAIPTVLAVRSCPLCIRS